MSIKLEIKPNFNVVKNNVVIGHFATDSDTVAACVQALLPTHIITPISFSVTKYGEEIGCFQTKQAAQDLINLMNEMEYTFMRNQLN